MIIAVNEESSLFFKDFADEYGDNIVCVEHKAFVGITPIVEFMIDITPEFLAALSAYLIAKIQASQKEIRIKNGDIEIELKSNNITTHEVLEMLEKLEQKTRKK